MISDEEKSADEAEVEKAAAKPYNLKLREIEERVNDLKEKIFQIKENTVC